LPTVSATEALQKLQAAPAKNVSTGLPRLDVLLAQKSNAQAVEGLVESRKGFSCGQVVDIYGPPGSGKTAFW
jgi:RecA/RadA recombinase